MTKREKIGLGVIAALVAALIIFILLFIHSRNALNIAEHNIKALNDTVTQVQLKNGELLAYKNSLIIDKKELEKYLDISNKEVKSLEKQLKEKILYISKIEGQIKVDTIYLQDSVAQIDSCTYRYYFDENNQYYHVGGYTEVVNNDSASTCISDNSMNLDLKVGLDDDWKIFVTTDNPYVSFGSIDGALLDKDVYLKQQKTKHWGLGIQVGFGGQYGIIHKTFDVGPYIGIGISYNFLTF